MAHQSHHSSGSRSHTSHHSSSGSSRPRSSVKTHTSHHSSTQSRNPRPSASRPSGGPGFFTPPPRNPRPRPFFSPFRPRPRTRPVFFPVFFGSSRPQTNVYVNNVQPGSQPPMQEYEPRRRSVWPIIIIVLVLFLLSFLVFRSCTRQHFTAGTGSQSAVVDTSNQQAVIEEISYEIDCFMEDLQIQDLQSAADHFVNINTPINIPAYPSWTIERVNVNGARATARVLTGSDILTFNFVDNGEYWLIETIQTA